MKPDVDVVEPVVTLKSDRRGQVEQGECLGGDSKHLPRGTVEEGECLGAGGTGEPDVVVVEPVVKLKPDRRGPVEQGGCLGGDIIHVPRGLVEQGEFLGVGGTGDVVLC